MDIRELRKKTEAELHKLLKLKREQLRDLRFKVAAKQHKDVRELREVRRTIAQILTVIKEKQIISEFKRKNKEK